MLLPRSMPTDAQAPARCGWEFRYARQPPHLHHVTCGRPLAAPGTARLRLTAREAVVGLQGAVPAHPPA